MAIAITCPTNNRVNAGLISDNPTVRKSRCPLSQTGFFGTHRISSLFNKPTSRCHFTLQKKLFTVLPIIMNPNLNQSNYRSLSSSLYPLFLSTEMVDGGNVIICNSLKLHFSVSVKDLPIAL